MPARPRPFSLLRCVAYVCVREARSVYGVDQWGDSSKLNVSPV